MKTLFISPAADTNTGPKKAAEQIRIKTLEEIKQEKAAQSQSQKDGPSATAETTVNTRTTRGGKRAITVKDDSIGHIKTFSEILHAKKKREEQSHSPKKNKPTTEKAAGKIQGENDAAEPAPEAPNTGEIRVKTLEEIRREKAARIQVQQAQDSENKKSHNTEESSAKKPRILRVKKPAPQSKTLCFLTDSCLPPVTSIPPLILIFSTMFSVSNDYFLSQQATTHVRRVK